jgi:uncharacterized membrane protein
MTSIVDILKLSKGESLIKDYFVFKAKYPQKIEGHVAVTNKRVVLYGVNPNAEKSRLINEVNVNQVKGVDVFISPTSLKYKMIWQCVGFVFMLLGIALPVLASASSETGEPGPVAALGVIIIWIGIFLIIISTFRKMFWINIKTTGMDGIITSGSKHGGHIGGIKIGPDGLQFAQEIGALVLNVQQVVGFVPESTGEGEKEAEEETTPTPPLSSPLPPPAAPQPQQQAPPLKPQPALPQKPPAQIKCYKCGAVVTVASSERPIVIECPKCGVKGKLTA